MMSLSEELSVGSVWDRPGQELFLDKLLNNCMDLIGFPSNEGSLQTDHPAGGVSWQLLSLLHYLKEVMFSSLSVGLFVRQHDYAETTQQISM